MSTQQPPGESSPEPAPSYAQPQDPWAAFEQGVAAVPTDPIPGRDALAAGPSSVWSQETLQHGGPYGYVPQQPRNRAALYVLVICAVLLLGGGGGYSAWYVLSHRTTGTPTAAATTAGTTLPTASPAFDATKVKVNECLFNRGADARHADMITVPCSTANSYTVLKFFQGATIPKDSNGEATRDITAKQLCDVSTDPFFWWNDSDDTRDVFLCLKKN